MKKYIKEIIQLFLPGYIFIITSNYYLSLKSKSFELTILGSVIIGYVIQLACTIINTYINLPELVINMIAIILGFLSALLYAKIKQSRGFKSLSINLGRKTGDKDIWATLFDIHKGAHIRFFAKYNYEEIMIDGDVAYYDSPSDESCDIVIKNYSVSYKDGKVYKPNLEQLFYVNSKDIYGLEISQGKGKQKKGWLFKLFSRTHDDTKAKDKDKRRKNKKKGTKTKNK